MNQDIHPKSQKEHGCHFIGLVTWSFVCFLPAALGAFSRPGAWYASLDKPAWNPPSWVFGPVWTTLYILMAVAAWMVWKRGGFASQRRPLSLFLAQLALNALWTPVFFGMNLVGVALGVLLLLTVTLTATVVSFWGVHRLAACLLLPYLGWAGFASVLNATLWWMNR